MSKRMAKMAVAALTAVAMTGVLSACDRPSTMSLDVLDEASGVKVTAENAGAERFVSSQGAVTVDSDDVLVISPCLDRGKFHLTVESSDGQSVAYDADVDGRVMFDTKAEAGTYDIKVTGVDGATGWMTVFAQDAGELRKQDESLKDSLDRAGAAPGTAEALEEERAKAKGDD